MYLLIQQLFTIIGMRLFSSWVHISILYLIAMICFSGMIVEDSALKIVILICSFIIFTSTMKQNEKLMR